MPKWERSPRAIAVLSSGVVFTRHGPITLKNARHADDPRPLDETSACAAASTYSRAYLHHLMKAGELLGVMLLSEVNIAYYQKLTAIARAAIAAGRFAEFHAVTKACRDRGDLPPHSNSISGLDATPPADAQ